MTATESQNSRIDRFVGGWVEASFRREQKMRERLEREGRELPEDQEFPEIDDDGEDEQED